MRPSILFAAVCTAVLLSSCQRISRSSPPTELRGANLLLITLDTTRADRIGAYGYSGAQTPNLDGLAREGILFEHCITPTAYTLPAHSSIMTGLYPPQHGVRINGGSALGDSQVTLAERLRADGYRTAAFIGAFVLDGRWGVEQGFDLYDDEFQLRPDQRLDLAGVQRPANEVVDKALQWLQQDPSKPYFAWVHLYDPHTPYEPPEPFRSRFASGGLSSLYDGEIAFADSQLGRLLQYAGESGRAKNTIVVVMGDHGEGLGSHGEGEHGYYVYDYAIRVPLVMRIPGWSGVRVKRQVRTIDVFPTVLELLSKEKPPQVHGRSLLPLVSGKTEEQTRYAYSESMATNLQYGWSALYSLRTEDHKFIQAPRSELYDLKNDPGETENRLDNLRRVARQLRTELQKIREETARQEPKAQEANLDQETMRMLASLGYVGGSSSAPRDDQNLADPKDKIHLFESIGYAAHLIAEDKQAEAAKVLEIVLKDDPEIPQAQTLLVSAYRKTDRVDEAKVILDKVLRKNPGDISALIAMGEILLAEGKRGEVFAISKRALAEDERNARAYELMAEVHMSANEHAEALPLLRKVVEIQPKLTRSRINLAAALIGVGQLEEGERLLHQITADYPKFPLAYFHLGLLRERQGRLPEARAAYEQEIQNYPKSPVARFNLGNLLLRMGDLAGAERQMRTMIEQEPESARPYLLLGRTLLDRPGRLAEVEKLAEAGLARAREPDLKALGYFLLADVYSRQGRRAALQDALEKGRHYRSLIRS